MRARPIDQHIQRYLDDGGIPEAARAVVRAALARGRPRPDEVLAYCAQTLALARAAADDPGLRATLAWVIDSLRLAWPAAPSPAPTPTPTAAPRARDEGAVACFSPGEDCLDAIRDAFERTSRTADVCVFTITDDRIADAMLAAHRRGVRVRVITDNDKALDEGSDAQRLERAGVALRIDQTEHHMHHKFAVFDGERLLTGSYNWTRSAARNNEENLIVTRDPGLVRAFSEEFERLWARFGR